MLRALRILAILQWIGHVVISGIDGGTHRLLDDERSMAPCVAILSKGGGVHLPSHPTRVNRLFFYHVVQHVFVVASSLDNCTVMIAISLWCYYLLHSVSHGLISLMSDVRVLHRVWSYATYSTRIHVACTQEVKVALEMEITEKNIVRIIN